MSKSQVTKPASTSPLAQLAAVLSAPAATAPSVVKPVAAKAVALRGGAAIVSVKVGKPYRTAAAHNLGWWQAIGTAVQSGNGTASVKALLAVNVPAPFVGYCVRRGYLLAI